jgi:hypothetical protein
MSDAPVDLPGAHLALPDDENSAGESILKVVQRMFLKSFAWIGKLPLPTLKTILLNTIIFRAVS